MKRRSRARLAAAAFHDAVRHILADDGVFTLANHQDPRRFWTWNGTGWREELIPVEGAADGIQPSP